MKKPHKNFNTIYSFINLPEKYNLPEKCPWKHAEYLKLPN